MMKKISYSVLALFGLALKTNAAYNSDLALDAVYYSASAYCAAATIPNWNCGEPCR